MNVITIIPAGMPKNVHCSYIMTHMMHISINIITQQLPIRNALVLSFVIKLSPILMLLKRINIPIKAYFISIRFVAKNKLRIRSSGLCLIWLIVILRVLSLSQMVGIFLSWVLIVYYKIMGPKVYAGFTLKLNFLGKMFQKFTNFKDPQL